MSTKQTKGAMRLIGSPEGSASRLLRVPEVLSRTGLSRTSLWRLEKAGQFPARRRISANAVGYLSDEVDAWLRERPTADDAA